MRISLSRNLLCFVIITVFIILWKFNYPYKFTGHETKTDFRMKNYRPIILLYHVPDWMKRIPIVPMDVDCVVTSDKNYLDDIRKYDALVFCGSKMWSADKVFPLLRSPDQYYVFAYRESPSNTRHTFLSNEIYNLTMTYRRDSDIYWPYGFINNNSNNFISDLQVPDWKTPDFGNKLKDDVVTKVLGKSKTAAWFVSNCHAKSKRDNIASVLKKHIDVDIYGRCGTLQCSRKERDHCYQLVEEKYFFYLSFENSICKDYLTEKIFNIMEYYVVPVVYGGANYSHYLPPHSYIDANDFETASDLAKYLKYLTQNFNEYVKYFWWKPYYDNVITLKSYNNLCLKLHEYTSEGNKGQFIRSYGNISSWWNDNQCTDPKIKAI